MPPKRLLVLLAALVAACSGGDDGEESTATTGALDGCPIAASAVGEALGRAVTVDEGEDDEQGCTYVGQGDDAAGARVEVSLRSLGEEAYGDVLGEVERRAGPTVPLADDDVGGADVGWIVSVGRAVQVGAADGRTLVVVAVTDPLLDAEAAGEVAMTLAGEALTG